MNDSITVRDVLVVDRGPVANAATILVTTSTLADHVTIESGEYTTAIEMDQSIPFELWGSGTQALWRLLAAIAYRSETVSLHEVVSRLDVRNQHAVANAVSALCEVAR